MEDDDVAPVQLARSPAAALRDAARVGDAARTAPRLLHPRHLLLLPSRPLLRRPSCLAWTATLRRAGRRRGGGTPSAALNLARPGPPCPSSSSSCVGVCRTEPRRPPRAQCAELRAPSPSPRPQAPSRAPSPSPRPRAPSRAPPSCRKVTASDRREGSAKRSRTSLRCLLLDRDARHVGAGQRAGRQDVLRWRILGTETMGPLVLGSQQSHARGSAPTGRIERLVGTASGYRRAGARAVKLQVTASPFRRANSARGPMARASPRGARARAAARLPSRGRVFRRGDAPRARRDDIRKGSSALPGSDADDAVG